MSRAGACCRSILGLLPLLCATSAAQAQTPAPAAGSLQAVTRAATAISAEAIRQHIRVLTADSMRDRATPSAGLERAARYVAAQFETLGLRPGLRSHQPPSWFQRYAIPGQQQVGGVVWLFVQLRRHGKDVFDEDYPASQEVGQRRRFSLRLGEDLYFAPEVGSQTVARTVWSLGDDPFLMGQRLILVSGRQSAASVRRIADSLRENTVLYLPSTGVDTAIRNEVIRALHTVSEGVLVVSTEDSARFAATAARQPLATFVEDAQRYATGAQAWPWVLWVRSGALRKFFDVAGIDVARRQADTLPLVQTVPSTVAFRNWGAKAPEEAVTAPNVVGLLEGTDLKDEYVVLSAHLDNVGTVDGTGGADATSGDDADARRRDDNAAGIAALLAVAQAFTQPGMRPRRSVLFVATSGGTRELWGANRFTELGMGTGAREWQDIVANLTLDRLDRSRGDTLWIDGLSEVDLALSPVWAATGHPELRLVAMDGGTIAQPTSDHFAFVRVAIPSLLFHTDRPTDTAAKDLGSHALDAGLVARIAALAFYVSQDAATAARRPQWSPEGRTQIRTLLDVAP